jgi:hypothetical protein
MGVRRDVVSKAVQVSAKACESHGTARNSQPLRYHKPPPPAGKSGDFGIEGGGVQKGEKDIEFSGPNAFSQAENFRKSPPAPDGFDIDAGFRKDRIKKSLS